MLIFKIILLLFILKYLISCIKFSAKTNNYPTMYALIILGGCGFAVSVLQFF